MSPQSIIPDAVDAPPAVVLANTASVRAGGLSGVAQRSSPSHLLRHFALLLRYLLRPLWFTAFVFSVLGLAAPACAHNQSYAVVNVQFAEDGTFEVALSFHVAALLMGQPQGHLDDKLRDEWGSLSDEDIRRLSDRASAYVSEALELYADKRRFMPERVVFPEPGVLRADGLVPAEEARPSVPVIVYGRFPSGGREFSLAAPVDFNETLLSIRTANEVSVTQVLREGMISHPVALPQSGEVTLTIPSMIVTFYQYLSLGFQHIAPMGLDHALFVLGLFLLAPRWGPMTLQISVFTLAHSATLALAVLGVVSVPSQVVEPLIAGSIMVVAVDNVLSRELKSWRMLVVFGFGLLHGMGFAGMLTALGLPAGDEVLALLSFNVGVELGQLAVLAVAFALLGWFRDRSWYRPRIAIPLSMLIALVGGFWMIERLVSGVAT